MRLEDAIKSNKFANEQHKASINLFYTAYWLKSHVSSALKELGITTEQYNVLRILKGKHPEKMCVKDISSRMVEKNSNVPRIVERLVVKKLVKRNTSKEDKRETLITLTEKGIQQLGEATEIIEATSKQYFGLDEQESATLNELLEKIRTEQNTLINNN